MPTNFSTHTHSAVCQQCQEERVSYLQNNQSPSPACVELFRRATAKKTEQTVWSCLDKLFTPLLTKWATGQHPFAVDDVIQETWLRFFRSSTTTFQIQNDYRLELILTFLRTILKNIVLEWLRKERSGILVPLDLAETDHNSATPIEQAQLRIDLERYIKEFLAQENFTDEERQLFRLKYLLHLKPREIQAEFPELAETYDQLEVALQRVSRRVKNYADFRNLRPSRRKSDDRTLLQLEDAQDGAVDLSKEVNVDEPCVHEENMLFDYLMGLTAAEIAVAIEASPACMQQVGGLAETFGPFLSFVYRLECPSPEQLVTYQQRTLPGTERLVLYRHIVTCPRCREDLMVLESMDVQNTATQPHLLHRIVEALYESPLTYGLQGSWLHYRTPEIFINISSRQNLGQARSWTVRVQVRSHEGELLTAAVKSATLEGIGQAVGRLYQLDQQQTTRHESSLTFRDVEAGHYCFSIILPDKEIIIRRMAVGIEDDENGRVEQG